MILKYMSQGSDVAETINLDVDVVINVQGDEPFINAEPLKEIIEVFLKDFEKSGLSFFNERNYK
jgi:3-deoxy-manno-octulosonate cytidylyltransferase (CMP-KDO synthetase)